MNRSAEIQRKTNETDIAMSLNIDGRGKADINTGIGFFGSYVKQFCKTWLF